MSSVKSGKIHVLQGASRSGKTQRALKLIGDFKRVLIWDVEGQYQAQHRARNQKQLHSILKQLGTKPAIVAYTGSLKDFDFFCQIANWYGRRCGFEGLETLAVFEETADVTNPGKAPEHYGLLLRRILKRGMSIIAITQRQAESDKTAVGNASVMHICRLQKDTDRRAIAKDSGVPLEEIAGLRADQDKGEFDYISVDCGRGQWRKGQLTFPRGKPKFTGSAKWIPL